MSGHTPWREIVTQASQEHRGYFGIGVERSKCEANVGTLWRSAYSLGASYIFTIGHRYGRQSTDTTQAWKHIPLLEYADAEDFLTHRPLDSQLVGIEICERAQSLERFEHPERAVYILGPEDGSLSERLQMVCQSIVSFSSRYCLNVAAAGTIGMYDRQTKLGATKTTK